MPENEEIKREQQRIQEAAEEVAAPAKKKKKKPNFSKPFIISGVLLGVFAGAPFLNLGNYIFGLWGWTFGLLAAWFLSREFKYFEIAQGGMVGFLTGLVGCAIAMGVDIGLCVANINVMAMVAAVKPTLDKFTDIMDFWIPERFHNAIILPTWAELENAYRASLAGGPPAVSPARVLAGHAFFMVPLLAGTAILGGILGCLAFAKKAPKRQFRPVRRRRPAGKPAESPPAPEAPPAAEVPPTEAAAAQPPAGESPSPDSPESAPAPAEAPQGAQAVPESRPEEPEQASESYEYGSGLPGSSEGEHGTQEGGSEQKEE